MFTCKAMAPCPRVHRYRRDQIWFMNIHIGWCYTAMCLTFGCQNHAPTVTPRYQLNTFWWRAFSVPCPTLWNSLPDLQHDPTFSFDSFWGNFAKRNYLWVWPNFHLVCHVSTRFDTFIDFVQQTKLCVELVVSSVLNCAVWQARHRQNACARHVKCVVSWRVKWNLGFIKHTKCSRDASCVCAM